MKIIILGAGQVGGSLAEHLADERNDITLVDLNGDRLRELQDQFDIGTVVGHASHPSVLRQAGADDAELLIAVTDSDEINMIACQIACSVFNVAKRIARIRAIAYLQDKSLFCPETIPIDITISPESLVMQHVRRLIRYPGALQVLNFAEGKVLLVAVKAYYGGTMVGHQIREIRRHMPDVDTRVAAIFRRNRPLLPAADTVIEAGDEVFFIVAREDIMPVMGELRRLDSDYQRIMIAGGGNIGGRLARALEADYQVKLIESSYNRCQQLSEYLRRTIVLHGNASNRDLLIAENIEDIDVFCAMTNNDETNIMSSMLAKSLGVKKVITLILNPAYVDLVQGGVIDVAISPQQITTGGLLRHVRRGDMANVYPLRRGAAEALEVTAHGDRNSSKVVGRRLGDIQVPAGVTTGAVVRSNGQVLIAHRDIVVESNDHIILFLLDRSKVKQVEKLFYVQDDG